MVRPTIACWLLSGIAIFQWDISHQTASTIP